MQWRKLRAESPRQGKRRAARHAPTHPVPSGRSQPFAFLPSPLGWANESRTGGAQDSVRRKDRNTQRQQRPQLRSSATCCFYPLNSARSLCNPSARFKVLPIRGSHRMTHRWCSEGHERINCRSMRRIMDDETCIRKRRESEALRPVASTHFKLRRGGYKGSRTSFFLCLGSGCLTGILPPYFSFHA